MQDAVLLFDTCTSFVSDDGVEAIANLRDVGLSWTCRFGVLSRGETC